MMSAARPSAPTVDPGAGARTAVAGAAVSPQSRVGSGVEAPGSAEPEARFSLQIIP